MNASLRRIRLASLALTVVWLLAACSGTCAKGDEYFPDAGWRPSTPEEQGIDSRALTGLIGELSRQAQGFHGLLVIRHGYLVAEVYFPPYRPEFLHALNSCTKSVTSILIGMAISGGILPGVDQKVLSFFPERTFANLDERKRAITLRHVLAHASGIDWWDWAAAQPGAPGYLGPWLASADKVGFLLDRPMAAAPGTRFRYTTAGSHLLSAVFQKASGMPLAEYARRRLFAPLGIGEAIWRADSQQVTMGGFGLFLHPADMARIGYLFLHQGRWAGRQVVDPAWVRQSTRSQIDAVESGYGFQWWVVEDLGGYYASGFGGQVIGVLPEKDLVLVLLGGMDEPDRDHALALLADFVQKADLRRQALPPNPEAARALAGLPGGGAPHPPDAATAALSGKWFRLSGSAFEGFQRLSLVFSGSRAEIRLGHPSGSIQPLFIGPTRNFFLSPLAGTWPDSARARYGSLSGAWTGPGRYQVTVTDALNSEIQQWDFTFRERQVEIARQSLTRSITVGVGSGTLEE